MVVLGCGLTCYVLCLGLQGLLPRHMQLGPSAFGCVGTRFEDVRQGVKAVCRPARGGGVESVFMLQLTASLAIKPWILKGPFTFPLDCL